jgi:uncharacterized membrane protein YedE/YeeE
MGVLIGLITGFFFGIVLQRGRLCFNSAIRDLRLFKDNYLWKAVMLAIALEMIAYHFMAQVGWITLTPKPFMPVGNIIGGLLFGFGMVLAGGCASGVTYRSGEGMTTAWMAAIFYGLFATASKAGFLKPIVKWLQGPAYTIDGTSFSKLYTNGKVGPTIASIFHINPWIPTIIITVLLLWYVFGTKTSERSGTGFKWYTTAILVTLVGMLGFYTRGHFGDKFYTLGITGGWKNIYSTFTGGHLEWEGAEVLGIIIGALVSALIAKEFKLRMPRKPEVYVQVALGGILLGVGASVAGGCNIGHFLSGVPQLSLGSWLATLFFILGNWTMAYWMYGRR